MLQEPDNGEADEARTREELICGCIRRHAEANIRLANIRFMSITAHPRGAIGAMFAAVWRGPKNGFAGGQAGRRFSSAKSLRPPAMGPVFDFVRVIGPRLMGEIFGDVDSVLVREEAALSLRKIRPVRKRHVGFDEGGGRVGARHPGADVERAFAPQRRNDEVAGGRLRALAVRSVADGAVRTRTGPCRERDRERAGCPLDRSRVRQFRRSPRGRPS